MGKGIIDCLAAVKKAKSEQQQVPLGIALALAAALLGTLRVRGAGPGLLFRIIPAGLGLVLGAAGPEVLIGGSGPALPVCLAGLAGEGAGLVLAAVFVPLALLAIGLSCALTRAFAVGLAVGVAGHLVAAAVLCAGPLGAATAADAAWKLMSATVALALAWAGVRARSR
jgi:hypothetical protein